MSVEDAATKLATPKVKSTLLEKGLIIIGPPVMHVRMICVGSTFSRRSNGE